MKIAVVYDKTRVKGNERFTILLSNGLNRHGIKTKLFTQREEALFDCDAAVMRVFDKKLSNELTENGIPVFNNLKTQTIANDKAVTYEFLKSIDVPFIPYRKYKRDDMYDAFPCIVKSVDGHGGTEVFFVNDRKELTLLNERIGAFSNRFIVQELADSPNDKRVYVMGGEIIAAMKRVNRYSFKSNYKLGGTACQADVTKEEKKYIGRIYEALKCDYVGIDFLTYKGLSVVNEIEDIVGCRMIYENTNIDILGRYADYIATRLK